MPTAAQIKTAARKLPVKDRVDLLESFAQDRAVRQEQVARLRTLLDEGERDHREGRFVEIRSAAEHRTFFDAIKREGRARQKRTA